MKEKTVTLFERGIGPGEESLLIARATKEQTRRRDLAVKNIKQRLEAAAQANVLTTSNSMPIRITQRYFSSSRLRLPRME